MVYFFDTCALLELQEEAFKKAGDDKFYISIITLQELENIKTSFHKDETTKYKARKLLHLLRERVNDYITLPYFTRYDKAIEEEFGFSINNDMRIIYSAYLLSKNLINTFVTGDTACLMLASEPPLSLKVEFTEKKIKSYSGYKKVCFTEESLASFYNTDFHSNKNTFKLLDNQYLLIELNGNIVDKYRWCNNKYNEVKYNKFNSNFFGNIAPKDLYQTLAMDSLANNQITVLRGPAGTGKSYLAFGYMFNLLEKGKRDKIIIFCNTVATKGSAKLGFYPGTREEKLLDSQIGNLLESKLSDRYVVEDLLRTGKLVLLPMSDIRGYDTTGMNAAVYITEAQNLDIELMKLALQRIGEDSICILDGDDEAQVDMDMYAGSHNGLKRVLEVFKGQDFFGAVELKTIHRSKIASLAQLM